MTTSDVFAELRLVSLSCTTGWTDWAHGELWVGSQGALRINRGLEATIKRGGVAAAVPQGSGTRHFSSSDIAELQAKSKKTRWVPWQDVSKAVIQKNLLTDLVRLTTASGTVVLWWMKTDLATTPVVTQLEQHQIPLSYTRRARFVPARQTD